MIKKNLLSKTRGKETDRNENFVNEKNEKELLFVVNDFRFVVSKYRLIIFVDNFYTFSR